MGIIEFVPRVKPAGYNRNKERWLPQAQRTILTDSRRVRTITDCLYHAFVLQVKELEQRGWIDLSRFPAYWESEIRYKNYELPVLALDEISFLPYKTQVEVIINMIAYAHNSWANDYSADFFGYYMGYEFLYLPIELAGEEMFRRYYDILSNHMVKLGLDGTNYDMVQKAYYQKQSSLLKRYKITDANGLTDLVVLIGQKRLVSDGAISSALTNRAKAFEVAGQLMWCNPELFGHFRTQKVAR